MKELICIVCPRGCRLVVDEENDYSTAGNACPRGAEYARAELTAPTRVLTSTVAVTGGIHPRCPVKTAAAIPKGLLPAAMRRIRAVCLAAPVQEGQVVIPDLLGTGVDLVACRDLPRAD